MLNRLDCRKLKEEGLEYARNNKWGTYGPNGNEGLRWVPIIELSSDHIENILITQRHPSEQAKAAMIAVLNERKK
jgi:hypothetical protein